MRLAFALLVLGAVLLSISSVTASTQADKEDDVVPSGEDTRFLRGLETTDSEERWGIRDLFGRKKFEQMLLNNWDELNKFKVDTVISKLKGTKHGAELLTYLNSRPKAVRAAAK
ncbi:hypothetical protein DVH05_021320 [Phytophthora capsici]|nr:hypothetical protein DVH05_021320 [Phytophthora capsici]